MGAEADVDGVRVMIGNERLFGDRTGTPDAAIGQSADDADGRSAVFVSTDGEPAGVLMLADSVRETAKEAIGLLREQGIRRVAMLTGDRGATAARIAAELGVDDYYAELLPAEKYEYIRMLRTRHGSIVMVGDGINDAPALAAADVGIAMAVAGSGAALETADVALMSDELLRVPYAIRLARATIRNVRMNVAISLALKAAFLVMAVAGIATLWMAVLADTGASVIVVGNALRLLRAR
jgi:Cd2+/Zn2+-exporting ATPase